MSYRHLYVELLDVTLPLTYGLDGHVIDIVLDLFIYFYFFGVNMDFFIYVLQNLTNFMLSLLLSFFSFSNS